MSESEPKKDKKSPFMTILVVALIAVVGVQSYLLFKKSKTAVQVVTQNEKGEEQNTSHLNNLPRNPFDERDVFAEMRVLQNRIDRMFAEHFSRGFDVTLPNIEHGFSFYGFDIDLHETENEFIVSCDIPGMNKDQIEVHLDGNVLTIQGEREQVKQEKNQNAWISRERHFGSFSRSIALPAPVDAGSVQAEYKKGVLNIRVKKLGSDSSEKTRIQVI